MAPKHQDERVESLTHLAAAIVATEVVKKGLELVEPILKPIALAVPQSIVDDVRVALGGLLRDVFAYGLGLLVDTGHVRINAKKVRVVVHEGPPPK